MNHLINNRVIGPIIAAVLIAVLLFLFMDDTQYCITKHFIEMPEKVILAFAGDVMIHEAQIHAAFNPQTQTYNYNPCFELIAPFIKGADLAIANLETTLAGEDRHYAGYPAFNAPEQLAPALKETGFDLICTANNHSLDRGEYGVIKTLEHLEEAGLKPFGTYRSFEEREKILTVEIKGIKIAFLSYTYGTNNIPIPEGKEYLVNLLDTGLMINDIQRIKSEVNLVVLYLHWGVEYQRTPSDAQRKLAETLLKEGADLIIGSHPHVVQPVEFVKSKKGNIREKVVAYSLGNLISDQRMPYTDSGIILYITLGRDPSGGFIELIDVSFLPVRVNRYDPATGRSFLLVPAPDNLHQWAKTSGHVLTKETLRRLEELQETYKKHMPYLPLKTPFGVEN